MPTPIIEESMKFIKNNELFFKMMFDKRATEWREKRPDFALSSISELTDSLADELTNWNNSVYFLSLESAAVRDELEKLKNSSSFKAWKKLKTTDIQELKTALVISDDISIKKNLIHFDKFLEKTLSTVWSLQKKKHRAAENLRLLYIKLYQLRNQYAAQSLSLDEFKEQWKTAVNLELDDKTIQTLSNSLKDAADQIQGIEHERIDAGDETLSKAEMQILKNHLNAIKPLPKPTVKYAYFFNDHELQKPIPFTNHNRETVQSQQESTLSPKFESPKNPIGINVEVIKENGKILVKVGPCDLSGIGGHLKREEFIKNIVNDALKHAKTDKTYEEVNVSACVGVRGRLQMFTGFFKSQETIQKEQGQHMNAYIKTAGEKSLEHWEPRKGPQGFFNDTICGMVIAVGTNMFEHRVMEKESYSSSKQATDEILKNNDFKKIFDKVLSITRNKIAELVDYYKSSKGPGV